MLICVKQKTAYEWSISVWSSDVCSSELRPRAPGRRPQHRAAGIRRLVAQEAARRGQPYTHRDRGLAEDDGGARLGRCGAPFRAAGRDAVFLVELSLAGLGDRKSTRLNSSH